SKADEKTIDSAIQIFENEFPGIVPKTIRFIRPEFEFGKNIIEKLFLGYEIKSQYHVNNYVIDWYIPELRIAIEFDEKHHSRNIEIDGKRQQEVEKELKCKFLRYQY